MIVPVARNTTPVPALGVPDGEHVTMTLVEAGTPVQVALFSLIEMDAVKLHVPILVTPVAAGI